MMWVDYGMLEQLIGDSHALDRAIAGEDLSYKDGLELMNYDNLHLLGAVADARRKELVGDTVTFAASYYMNYTNVCAASCQMCAFYRKDGAEDAYTLTPQEIEQRVGIAKQMGATEVHIVGGFHPKLPLEYYEDMMKIIKKNHPQLNIKALTAAEIFYLSKLTKNSTKEILSRLKEAGLDSMPGGGAELFHPEIRKKIVRGKCTGQEWLDVIEEAHNMGIKSNVTMLYGHIEKPEHIVDHLIKIRDLQKKTNGFITLIPLKFSLDNTELEQEHLVNNECSSVYDLRVIALSRLMLANYLNNISVYWVAYGKKLAQVALSNGGSDLVGTAFSEEIYRAAGKATSSSVDELATMVKEIGRTPAQRNTHFGILKNF
ncbi:FO synthase subunit 2 protein [Marine Group I thaumarchaeote SCGC AAA799-E16]|uniref:FO synthase subunit 2 protein n=4 Tax=Marine Group I TaxID=905826 RepID=A0A087S605_9ARCH|nr:FO synthase subunit 2 protein [Marine Group I thaumarchaeote SCGC AAA799-N04]KER05592.1 FO synthase subunit 2 protein [Marine Group I thaumarchaeote SCGC AAA799-E16]KFM18207.1 FO synthase subunit 2 protein [Marine Group I thaumarchaeote SCGC RSA3]KFM21159.1 FO synthase subunit 2 protein [Marine Group I thaumarchaeote SCGC AAA799-B03]